MKRNSPDSSHSRPQRQQESKIEGIKTIGIISTPIIWPVKQRPLHFSKNSADENPERKNMYGVFHPTVSTSAAYEETSNGTLAVFSEKIKLDNTVMHQLQHENILNDSRISFHGTYDTAGAVTDPSVNAAVPFLQNRSLTAEATWTLANGLGYADSESPFHSAVSRSTAYEHRKEALWIPSSSNSKSNFIHLNDVLETESWWSETVFHHHITSDFQEERFNSLASLSISPLREKLSFQKSRIDLLDFSPRNIYPEMIEGNTNRKPVSVLAESSEFQFRKSMYTKEPSSGGITNLNSVEVPHANPTAFFHNMKKTYTAIMPNIQLTNSITGSSRKQLVSALLVGISRTNSAFNHVETTLPLYQQSGMYSDSDSIFMSNSDYWSHYLKYSVYFQKKMISETLRNAALESNLDAFHNNNQNEDSDFSILETDNINRVGNSWEPGYLDFLTKYVDISPSLTASFWTVSYHLKEVSQAFSGEPSENQWLSFNKLLSSPTEKLPSISSPTKPDSTSEETFTIRLLDHGAKEINFSSHASTLERQIFSLFVLGLSKRISESNEKTISQMQSKTNFANLTISSNDAFYFAFPFSSVKSPLSQHSVQISPFDKALANSTKKIVVFDSLNMQVGTDIESDRTNVTILNNRQQLVSVLPTHPGTHPSCSRDNQTAFLVNTPVNSFINSTRTHGSLQSQNILKSDEVSNTIDNARSEVQMDAAIFLKSNDSASSDFLTTTLSLELRHTFHSESKFKLSVPLNSYSTPPLPQRFQNHLDTISPSLIPGQDVAELSLPTTPVTPSQLTFLGQNFLENQGDGIGYSLWAVEQEITGDNKEKTNSAVQTSTNKSRLSDQDLEREVYGSFSTYRGRMSSLNIGSTHVLDFENVNYGHYANFSSLLALSRTAVMNDTMLLSSSYSGIIIQQKETILKHILMTPGAVIHHSYIHSRMPVSPVMYHQSSGLAHIYSLANFSTGKSQNTTPYPPPNQLTGNPTVLLSCLNSTELGCLCRPEVNYSMLS